MNAHPAVSDTAQIDGYSLIDGQYKTNAGLLFISLAFQGSAEWLNLFPNGGVEDEFLYYLSSLGRGFSRSI